MMIFIIILLLVVIFLLFIRNIYLNKRIINIENNAKINLDKFLKERLDKSRSVIRGQISEQIVPLLPNFPYNLKDCKFLGLPVDYIIFDGMSDYRDNNIGDISIILVDVKTGNSKTSKVQNKIREAIRSGRIKFEVINV